MILKTGKTWLLAMHIRRSTLLNSFVLLIVGLGIGCSGTLLVLKWTSPPPVPERTTPEPPPAPKLTTEILLKGEPAMGSTNAPITIVEFSDFECPYCKWFYEQVLPQLKTQFVDTGLVRFVHKDLPLPFHQQAKPAAAATRCADEQNRYWELYGAIFDQQTCLKCKGIDGIAKELDLDIYALKACMNQGPTQVLIEANVSEAALHNIRSTPTFVIGPTRPDGKHRGKVVEGAMPWPQFKALIDLQLKALGRP